MKIHYMKKPRYHSQKYELYNHESQNFNFYTNSCNLFCLFLSFLMLVFSLYIYSFYTFLWQINDSDSVSEISLKREFLWSTFAKIRAAKFYPLKINMNNRGGSRKKSDYTIGSITRGEGKYDPNN